MAAAAHLAHRQRCRRRRRVCRHLHQVRHRCHRCHNRLHRRRACVMPCAGQTGFRASPTRASGAWSMRQRNTYCEPSKSSYKSSRSGAHPAGCFSRIGGLLADRVVAEHRVAGRGAQSLPLPRRPVPLRGLLLCSPNLHWALQPLGKCRDRPCPACLGVERGTEGQRAARPCPTTLCAASCLPLPTWPSPH